MGGKTHVKEEYLKTMIVRKPTQKLDNLHPAAKRVFNRMIQEPEPLTYKLQEIPEKDAGYYWEISKPLGNTENIPFSVTRTHTENLPVYTEFKAMRSIKETHIRNIKGDVEEFKRELRKIVSNADVTHRVGKVIINGMHTQKVKLWLRKLGF
jgi:large subunit ribosomal protein L49